MADEQHTVTAITPAWSVDQNGFLLTVSGAKAARISEGAIMLYDKREHVEVPFTLADWVACQTQTPRGEP